MYICSAQVNCSNFFFSLIVANITFKHIHCIFVGCLWNTVSIVQQTKSTLNDFTSNRIKNTSQFYCALFTNSIQLVNGKDTCSGRLQFRAKSDWHSFCLEDLTHQSARVVCRQLGCGVHSSMTGLILDQRETSKWGIKMDCRGNEATLENCRFSEVPGKLCFSEKAIWLSCSGTDLI